MSDSSPSVPPASAGPPDRRQKLVEIIGEALGLPEQERAAFIFRSAAGDAVLEAEAMSLVDAAARAGGFLERPTAHGGGTGPNGKPAAEPSIREGPGTVIGRYRLQQQIGEGGFGVVFMAEQRDPVHRQVALKIIKLGMDTRAVVARFEAERQALAIMDHPSIARVFDAGATESGRPFFVMELVRGDSIVTHCDKQGYTTRQRLELFAQVCQAVQHAHSHGVIHRDIKPGNVLITIIDGHPVPKVIDFGIAKATAGRLTDKTVFTEFRQMIGTPAYMSPEQADNAGVDVDTRSDIYSLGVLLYELLTGVTPFDPERLRSAAWAELQRIIREEDPPTPSTRLSGMRDGLREVAAHRSVEPSRLASAVRGDLDWIVMRCLDKDRSRRYPTADALAKDVQNCLSGQAVSAAPPSTAYLARKFIRRHRVGVVAVSVVFAALALGVIGTGVGLVRAERHRREAVAEKRNAENLAEFLQATFSSVSPWSARGRDTVLLKEILDGAVIRIDRGELKASPEAEIRLRSVIGSTYANIARFDSAEAMLNKSLEMARARWAGDNLATADCLHQLAGLHGENLRQFDKVEPLLREELAMRRRLYAGDHATVARVLSGMGLTVEQLGRRSEAEQLHREAVAMQRRIDAAPGAEGGVRDTDALVFVTHNLAAWLERAGRPIEAEPLFREGLAMRRRLHPGDHLSVADGVGALAGELTTLGRYAEAETMYREALEMRKRLHGGDHPDIMLSCNNLANVINALGRPAEAQPLVQEALAMARRLFPADHRMIVELTHSNAVLLHRIGRLEEAEAMHREALEAKRRIFKGDHRSVAQSLTTYAKLLGDLGRAEEAEPLRREAVDMRTRLLGPDHADTATAQADLGTTLVKLSRAEEAEPLFAAALAVYEKSFKGDHPNLASTHAGHARCLAALGKHDEAVAAARLGAEMAARLFPEGHESRVECDQVLDDVQKILGAPAGPPKNVPEATAAPNGLSPKP